MMAALIQRRFFSTKNLYHLLGVSENASASAIKNAYYEKAKKLHPDANKSDPKAAEKFQEISEAYQILGDAKKRQAYDARQSAGSRSTGPGGFAGSDPFQSSSSSSSFGGYADAEDLFRKIFKEFEGNYEFKTNAYADEWDQGETSQVNISVSFKEAAIGCDKEINITSPSTCDRCFGSRCEPGTGSVKCPYCHGTGTETITNGPYMLRSTCRVCKGSRMYVKSPCASCRGKGQRLQTKQVIVPVPAGVTDGQTVRMRLQGNTDLYVTFKVAKSSYFKRDDADIHTDADISISQAILGGTVRVEGLYEDLSVTINPGTSSHTKIRVPQKGIKRLNSYGRGDHYVHVRIKVPERITDRQRKLISEFDEEKSSARN